MAPRSEIKPVAAFIPFTRFPGQDSISFLLWKFHRNTLLQSARFYHDLVIPSPPVNDDAEYQDAIARRDLRLCEYVDLCFPGLFPGLRKRIRSSRSALRLKLKDVELILLPVRPIRQVESPVGSGLWIDIDQLRARLQSLSFDCNFGPDRDVYLPTMASLREHWTDIIDHLERLGLIQGEYGLDSGSGPTEQPAGNEPSETARPDEFYSCSKCNRVLFSIDGVQHHDPTQSNRICTNIFLKDSTRAFGDLVELSGKINCPRCSLRLGSYDWSGSQCSCGCWIAPAIQITASRVDLMRKYNYSSALR